MREFLMTCLAVSLSLQMFEAALAYWLWRALREVDHEHTWRI